jgi:hypothetical protein
MFVRSKKRSDAVRDERDAECNDKNKEARVTA